MLLLYIYHAKERSKTRSLSNQNKACQRCESAGSLYQRRLYAAIQTKAQVNTFSLGSKRLLRPKKEHVLKRSSHQSHEQTSSGKGGCQVVPGLLLPSLPSSQTKQKMEANLRPESTQPIPQHRHFQNGDSRDNPVVLGNGSGSHRRTSATHTSTFPLPKGQESVSGSSFSIKLFSSQLFPSGWPQLP